MKRIVLVIILASMILPGMGQTPANKREKKHTPRMEMLRNIDPNSKEKKEASRFSFLEMGTLSVKNNAQLDSSLVYIRPGVKEDGLILMIKEVPVYYEETNLIKELVSWYSDDFKKEFVPGEKLAAFYDDNGNLIRQETYIWEGEQWVPEYATEMVENEMGEEIFYAEYSYNTGLQDWEMDYGYRAHDQFDEDGLLSVRTWEYFYAEEWMPESKEEYIYDENNNWIGLESAWYDEVEGWELESRMVFELDENGAWAHGYSYEWDSMEEDWYPAMKYLDIVWINFDLIQFSEITIQVNPEVFGDWDYDKQMPLEEIAWMNFLQMNAAYTDNGLMKLMQENFWDDETEEWIPVFKLEMDYDHFDNTILEVESIFEAGEWSVMEGIKINMDYNDDLSINTMDGYALFQEWGNEYTLLVHFEYFYPIDYTAVPVVNMPEALKIFPNPASSQLNVVWSGADEYVDITIIALDGRVVARYEQCYAATQMPVMLDVSQLNNGVYIVQSQGKQQRQVGRFLKK